MAFTPVEVDSAYEIFPPLLVCQPCGPFYRAGRLYGVFADWINFTLEVWSSAADGASWSEEDAGNHPLMEETSAGGYVSWGVEYRAGVIHVIWRFTHYPVVTDEFRIARFSTITKEWLPVITSSVIKLPMHYEIFTLSDGTTRIVTRGDSTIADPQKVYYIDYTEAGGWGSFVEIASGANPYDFLSCALGADDLLHVFLGNGSGDLQHRSVAPDGTLGTLQTVSAGDLLEPVTFDENYISSGNAVSWFDLELGKQLIALPYAQASTGNLVVAIAESVQDPTWESETISSDYPPNTSSNSGFASAVLFGAPYAESLHLVWVSGPYPNNTNIYWSKRTDGGEAGSGVWSAGTLHRATGVDTGNVSAWPSPYGVGLFWTELAGSFPVYYDLIEGTPCDGLGGGGGGGQPYRVII